MNYSLKNFNVLIINCTLIYENSIQALDIIIVPIVFTFVFKIQYIKSMYLY